MSKRKIQFIGENENIKILRKKESRLTRKIVRTFALAFALVVVIGGLWTYHYVSQSLQPVDASQTEVVEIEIPSGASVSQIATILQEKNIIRDARMFNFYIKFKNVSGFKSGFYQLSPSMNLDQILEQLADGGSDRSKNAAKVVVREGEQLTEIAEEVAKNTSYTAEEFMTKVQDQVFIDQLIQKFPNLLNTSSSTEGARYFLEGYLFPATYEMDDNQTLQMLIESMVSKTDEILEKYYTRINSSGYTVRQILTMASLVEKEGSKLEDRQKIAGVFYNRIAANMMLQTDISVLYALGEHKEVVTLADLEVESPYNLYRNYGMGPGPFNSPSEEAIVAALEPAQTDFLYFVADIQTKEVYYAKTYDEHLELVAKYVNKQ